MIRPATPSDAEKYVEWSYSTPSNGFNSSFSRYPHLFTFAVDDERGPLLYAPTHPVYCIESVAVRPDITPKQYIEALLEVKAATENLARQNGIREIHTSSVYRPMVRTLCRHGYAPIVGTALRKVVE
jgi:hypothetical protein